jgi:hypothetical protein
MKAKGIVWMASCRVDSMSCHEHVRARAPADGLTSSVGMAAHMAPLGTAPNSFTVLVEPQSGGHVTHLDGP